MNIIHYPDPHLKLKCSPVDLSTAEKRSDIQAKLSEMDALMRAQNGLGLAANQVGLTIRAFVAASPQRHSPRFFVNPEIKKFSGKWRQMTEGCLSMPGFYEQARRNAEIEVAYDDVETGERRIETLTGYLAQVFQHELEHLNGEIFVDHLPKGALDRLRSHMRKLKASGKLNPAQVATDV